MPDKNSQIKDLRVLRRFMLHVSSIDPKTGCWIWNDIQDDRQYGKFGYDGTHRAHRISWRLFHGDIPDGLYVCHHCDNCRCVNPEHLFCGTQSDNIADMIRKNRRRSYDGSANPNAKLTEDEVRIIRNRWVAGERQQDLAKEFGVDQTTISRLVRTKNWDHVPHDADALKHPAPRHFRPACSPVPVPKNLYPLIRDKYASGMTQSEIAQQFNTHQATVSRIIRSQPK